ncbi:MAG: hypothetical protein H8D45_05870 [Bacteroidetes bacterium]|nr:hypothetical protein [Bacteroidota bacterium]
MVDNGYYYRIYSYYENNISSNAELKVYNTFFYTFGGSDGDIGQSVQQTNDNGFIITGSTSSYGAGSLDILIIKIDALGNEEFINTFGGSNDDQGYSIQQTNDNGFIIVGATKSYGCGNYDVWLIKTDAQGNEEWSNTFGESDNDWGHSVQQTNDNGFIITGSTSSYGSPGVHDETDVLLIKTDAQGNEEWVNTFGGYATQRGYSVKQTNDNGFIITGYKIDGSGMSCDVWLIKTDLNGNELWSKTFGGSDYDEGYSVQQTKDNGFIITGRTRSYSVGGYYTDVWLIKTDGMGNEEWNKTFGESEQDEGKSVYQTNDNGFIITGFTKSFGVYSGDVLLIKTDAQGNEEWINTFGGTSSDWGYSVQQTKDNGFIITGSSYISDTSDLLLIKTDNEGNVE